MPSLPQWTAEWTKPSKKRALAAGSIELKIIHLRERGGKFSVSFVNKADANISSCEKTVEETEYCIIRMPSFWKYFMKSSAADYLASLHCIKY